MKLADLLGDLMPKKNYSEGEDGCEYWTWGNIDDAHSYGIQQGENRMIDEISSIEIPEDRLREMGYVKKEV